MSGAPEVGTSAPAVGLRNQRGAAVDLDDLRGAPALLVFYPFAFSGVCSSELEALRDRTDDLQEVAPGLRVLAISCDSPYSLRTLADRDGIRFDLLSDFWPHGAVARAYGCFDEVSGVAGRSSFLLDASGRIVWSTSSPIGRARSVDSYVEAARGLV